jgi:AraC-like DNA-binding protein
MTLTKAPCTVPAAAAALFGAEAVPALRERGGLRSLAMTGDFVVAEVHCRDDRRGLAGPRIETSWHLVVVRRGGFLRRVNGREDFYDVSSAYLARPGDETYLGHPAGPGDITTAIVLPGELVDEAFAGRPPEAKLVTSPAFDLKHRLLLAACRARTDDGDVDERVHGLLAMLSTRDSPEINPATAAVHRRLVSDACEALARGGLTMGLAELARRVNCSPHHLSRVFRRVTGHTVTFHRNELRVRAVLEDIAAGATNLRWLAARYGFADQAHLARVVRRHRQQTPSALARILAGDEHQSPTPGRARPG